MSLFLLALLAALPPITTTPGALVQLKGANKIEALGNLKEACRGKYRRELRDKPELAEQLKAVFQAGEVAVKKAVLDTSPCFSNSAFAPLVELALADPDDAVLAYGAEVSARLEDPKLVAVLHAAMSPRRAGCLGPGLSNSTAEVCVWLTYAPGALLGAADEATRKTAGDQAAEMLKAEHAKVREVAVETLAATRIPAFAPKIAELLEAEKKFAQKNSKELLDRFRDREKTLKKGQPPKN